MKKGDRGSLATIFSKVIMGVLLFCGLVFLNAGAEAKRVGDVIRVGIWDGYKYIDNDTGKFSHCLMGAEFKSGITVFFSINRGYGVSVGFYNTNWKLQPGSTYPVRLSVDRSISQNINATANSKKTIRIVLRNKNAWYAAFRKGRRMRLEAANENFVFRLVGTYVALPRMLDCVDQALLAERRNGQNNPFAQTSKNPFSSAKKPRARARRTERKTASKSRQNHSSEKDRRKNRDQKEKKVEKEVFTTAQMDKILSKAGMKNYRVLNNKERKKLSGRAHQAWLGDGYYGFLIFTKHGKSETLETMSSSYLSRITGNCSGAFISGARDPVRLGKIRYRQVSAKCKRKSDTKLYYLTFIFGKSGMGITIMHIAENNAFEQAETADQKLRNFFTKIYSR